MLISSQDKSLKRRARKRQVQPFEQTGEVSFGIAVVPRALIEIEDNVRLFRSQPGQQNCRVMLQTETAHLEAGLNQSRADDVNRGEDVVLGCGVGVAGVQDRLVVKDENSRCTHGK